MTEISSNVIGLAPKQNEHWEDPLLFHELDTPEIYTRWLPGILGDFAAAISQSTETPEALATMTVLGVLSTVFSKHVMVSPTEGWQEPVNIYTLIALPPANHKSWVLRACVQPLVDWEEAQYILLGEEQKRQRAERKTQEKIIEALRYKAAKTTSKLKQRALREEITREEIALIDIPALPLLFTNDATPESLVNLVDEQGGRMAIFSDEGGILETLAGLYTNGNANIDILLKGIDGGALRVDRKDRSIRLNPYLSIVFAVQPAVIQTMSEKRAYMGNGMLERFLYVLPKSNLGYRNHQTTPITTTLQKAYHAKVTALLNYFPRFEKHTLSTPYILTLSPSASFEWREFQLTLERELRPDGKLASCLGWGGKLCGFALRIAGLLHGAEYGINPSVIQESSMSPALAICTALIEHATAAFGLMGADQAREDAKTLFQWLKTCKAPSFTQSEITFALRNRKIGQPERLAKAIKVLQERHIIGLPVKVPTRKPTLVYHINPTLF